MPLDITPLLTPFFGVLTALVVLGAAVIAVAAFRLDRRRGDRPPPRSVRVEVRPPAEGKDRHARSA